MNRLSHFFIALLCVAMSGCKLALIHGFEQAQDGPVDIVFVQGLTKTSASSYDFSWIPIGSGTPSLYEYELFGSSPDCTGTPTLTGSTTVPQYSAPLAVGPSNSIRVKALNSAGVASTPVCSGPITRSSAEKMLTVSQPPIPSFQPRTAVEFTPGVVLFSGYQPATGWELWITDGTPGGTSLLMDINPGPASSDISNLTVSGGKAFFAANDGIHGKELWVTDGTASGTQLVADISPGLVSSMLILNEKSFVDLGGVLIFPAFSIPDGMQIYRSDGTAAGTSKIKTIGIFSAVQYAELERMGGFVYFTANDGSNGEELWRTDGTAAGTTQVADISTGFGAPNSTPLELTAIGGTLFFSAWEPAGGRELWKTDGTAAGTVQVKDINPGVGNSTPTHLTNAGGTLYFAADDGATGAELWKSDGTAAGTVLVKDINPAGASNPENFIDLAGTLIFTAFNPVTGREVYRSNGTTAGTVIATDLYPGTASGVALNTANGRMLASYGGDVYFAGDDGIHGYELWKTHDGTAGGTTLVADIVPGSTGSGIQPIFSYSGGLLFLATDASGSPTLFHSDGTSAGTVPLLSSATPDPYPGLRILSQTAGSILLSVTDLVHGTELWKSDGTAAGTTIAADACTGFCSGLRLSSQTADLGGFTYFVNLTEQYGSEIWKTDGTLAGTQLVADVNPLTGHSMPSNLLTVGSFVFFYASSTGNDIANYELWRTDGTAPGTLLTKDIFPGPFGSFPQNFHNLNGKLVFTATDAGSNVEIWTSDGTGPGTTMVKDINANASVGSLPMGFISPTQFVQVGSTIFTQADDGVMGPELWKTDGTAAGTVLVKEITPGPAGTSFGPMYEGGGKLWFSALDAATGIEPWVSDGTAAGTFQLADVRPGAASSSPSFIGNLGGIEYFMANDGTHGNELWRSDGTIAGTYLFKDFEPGPGSSNVSKIVPVGSKIFMVVQTSASGNELWVSDGTGIGTHLVKDINPGPAWSNPFQLVAIGDRLFFSADDGVHGIEPWWSDGTAAGTMIYQDINPGPGSSASTTPVLVNGTWIFSATDGTHGWQLWRLLSP